MQERTHNVSISNEPLPMRSGSFNVLTPLLPHETSMRFHVGFGALQHEQIRCREIKSPNNAVRQKLGLTPRLIAKNANLGLPGAKNVHSEQSRTAIFPLAVGGTHGV
jgi:hypothetical protein